MAEVHQSGNGGGRAATIVAIVAVLLLVGFAIWALTGRNRDRQLASESSRSQSEQIDTRSTGTADRDDDGVSLRVNLPDTVKVDID